MCFMDNFKQQFQIYWNIRWLRRSVISAITLIVMLVAIPFIIQYSISHLLIKQGANKVEIEDINLNLFAGTFELKQLAITTGNNKPSQLEHLYANINMLDLVLSKIVLHEVKILGLKADIHRSDDGTISINGLSYPANDSTAAKTDAEVSESKPLAFAIDSLSINNSHINYQETDFIQNNQIISLALTNLDSTDTTVDANLKLDSVLNDAPFKLTADLNLFNAVQHFKGNASLGSMAFTHYAKFYSSYVDKLQGNISIESDFDINLSARITAKISNHIQISDVDANYQGIQPGLKKLRLKGTTEISNIDFTNLQKHQSDAQANIKDSQLNLFTGTLELDQLAVSSADNIPSKIKHMEIAVEKLDALSNRFLINDILIDGVETNIERADNGQISINGLVIPTSVETDTTTP